MTAKPRPFLSFNSADLVLPGLLDEPLAPARIESVDVKGPSVTELRERVADELRQVGFTYTGSQILPPQGDAKLVARRLHDQQRKALLLRNADFLDAWEDRLLDHFASGADVDPDGIEPEVVPVASDESAAIFRFAALHWSVPVSQGYGRRTRFLLRDRSNGKIIGIFALGDPVFNLKVRDSFIGWDAAQRGKRLYSVFDGFVLGAVEPYRQLIGGKLIAMAALTDEVTTYLAEKYAGQRTNISGEIKEARPVLVTTTSALGRSSIYNRLKMGDRQLFTPVGYTEGFGHFHFSEELFAALLQHLEREQGFVRGNRYGLGPNWKIRTLRSGLESIGLDGDLLRHGVRRQVFLAPLGVGWRGYLRGESDRVSRWFRYDIAEAGKWWRTRWAVPRSERLPEYADHQVASFRLTPELDRSGQRRRVSASNGGRETHQAGVQGRLDLLALPHGGRPGLKKITAAEVRRVLAMAVALVEIRPASITLIGSRALENSATAADIDLFVLRPPKIPGRNRAWRRSWADLERLVEGKLGVAVHLFEIAGSDARADLRNSASLTSAAAAAGVHLYGADLASMTKQVVFSEVGASRARYQRQVETARSALRQLEGPNPPSTAWRCALDAQNAAADALCLSKGEGRFRTPEHYRPDSIARLAAAGTKGLAKRMERTLAQPESREPTIAQLEAALATAWDLLRRAEKAGPLGAVRL
jgi:hypothetical protein